MAMRMPGLGGLIGAADRVARTQLANLEARLAQLEGEGTTVREGVCAKVRDGGMLTRKEAAAYLGVSTKKLQRMEAVGRLNRCSGLGTLVRYASRDVLQLASANGKER